MTIPISQEREDETSAPCQQAPLAPWRLLDERTEAERGANSPRSQRLIGIALVVFVLAAYGAFVMWLLLMAHPK